MIVNKSRAHGHVTLSKLPLRTEDIEKIPTITEEIKAMLVSNPKIDAPYCYLSRLEGPRGSLQLAATSKVRYVNWGPLKKETFLFSWF